MPRNRAATSATPCPPATRFILRGPPDAAASAGRGFRRSLPLQPLRSETAGSRSALWLGPDEWLLIAEDFEPALGATLEAALANVPHALIDVSHRQGALEVERARARRDCSTPASCSISISPLFRSAWSRAPC